MKRAWIPEAYGVRRRDRMECRGEGPLRTGWRDLEWVTPCGKCVLYGCGRLMSPFAPCVYVPDWPVSYESAE